MYTGVWTNWYLSSDTKVRLAKLATMRSRLEENNLWDTYRSSAPMTSACTAYTANNRTVDGTCNDQTKTWMGSAGARFGRNMNPNGWFSQAETTSLMQPSPREVSSILFTRDSYKPVP